MPNFINRAGSRSGKLVFLKPVRGGSEPVANSVVVGHRDVGLRQKIAGAGEAVTIDEFVGGELSGKSTDNVPNVGGRASVDGSDNLLGPCLKVASESKEKDE